METGGNKQKRQRGAVGNSKICAVLLIARQDKLLYIIFQKDNNVCAPFAIEDFQEVVSWRLM
jgi:hypothetical protein